VREKERWGLPILINVGNKKKGCRLNGNGTEKNVVRKMRERGDGDNSP